MKFLADLKAAHRSHTESSGSSVVKVSVLANEFLKTHTEEEYKMFLQHRQLKRFLIQSSEFHVEGDYVTICSGM